MAGLPLALGIDAAGFGFLMWEIWSNPNWTVMDMASRIRYTVMDALIVLLIGGILLVASMSQNRTFEFCREGCTVSFLWYRRMYTWDELKTRRYVRYSGERRSEKYVSAVNYKSGVELYPGILKPYGKYPPSESFPMRHPLKFIYICFRTPETDRASKLYLRSYEAYEEEFRAKMAEWGVAVDEIDAD